MSMQNYVRAKAYSWAGRFTQGYPEEVMQAWAEGKVDFEFEKRPGRRAELGQDEAM